MKKHALKPKLQQQSFNSSFGTSTWTSDGCVLESDMRRRDQVKRRSSGGDKRLSGSKHGRKEEKGKNEQAQVSIFRCGRHHSLPYQVKPAFRQWSLTSRLLSDGQVEESRFHVDVEASIHPGKRYRHGCAFARF
ncbi:hypothetical protein PoB_000534800 [Plakobranchus ocellatus]|uniref:Uncharacterized protein n=1 Tax=Plakobranchus ocellatus TaxID=259542 RepID=A0AAV3Y8L0_9GAST|nr:hypothetical protein PoB_000534800 [Plakobranchus ocellatus]